MTGTKQSQTTTFKQSAYRCLMSEEMSTFPILKAKNKAERFITSKAQTDEIKAEYRENSSVR